MTEVPGLDDHLDRGHDNTLDIGALKGLEFADAIRALAAEHDYNVTTVTINGSGAGSIDLRDTTRTEAKSAEPVQSEFGKRATSLLREAADVYQQRNAVYKDNFRVVGRVMEALFPDGAPRLHDASDFNRWHIFELVIVKLTRYVANFENPDKDSLVDMLPYLAILGAQDDELREKIQEQIDHENSLRDRIKAAGLHTNEPVTYEEAIGRRSSRRRAEDSGPNYEADDTDDLLDV